MKLKKLVVAEVLLLAVALIAVMAFVEFVPYLRSSQQKNAISMYQEREGARGNVTLAAGQTSIANFTYTSYDPAILSLDITFATWKSPGYLTLRCNNRIFASLYARPENQSLSFTLISVGGREWVEPPSTMFGLNEIAFESELKDGYEGTFGYVISFRGSR